MKRVSVFCVVALCACTVHGATLEWEKMKVEAGTVVKGDAYSGGEAVRIPLDQAKAGQKTLVSLLVDAKPGKHELALRLRFEPADAYADSFTVTVGATSLTFMPTDYPDPKDADFRLWRVVFVADEKTPVLKLALQRPQTTEPKTAAVILDSLSLQERSTDAFLVRTRLNKVLYEPGEEAKCVVNLHNAGDAAAARDVRLVEVLDLGATRELGSQKANVAAKADAELTFAWNVGNQQYGREVRAEVLDRQGQAVDWDSGYVNVADNVWKVAMRASGIPHMTHPDSVYCDIKTPEAWKKYLAQFADRLHANYGNFLEWFAWAPDDVFYMTPAEESWISGQGCYQHVRSRVLDLNRTMNENGVWPITYAKSAASGPPCYEFMRKHPEFGLGRYQVQFDQQFVRDWAKQIPGKEKTIFYTWMSLVLDITRPQIVDAAIHEILSSGEMFGFRGARYDDHYTFWGKPYDELSTRNMQRIFELSKQRNPKFVWGFNYITMGTQCVWPGQPLPDTPWKQKAKAAGVPADPCEPVWQKPPEPYPELKVACENGGYIMNEEARGAHGGTYTNYARLLAHEARYVRKLGGHYGPIPFDPQAPSAFDTIYPDLLRCATRSHTYGDMRVDTKLKQFVTRYSAFIYGTALEPILDPEPVLTVDAAPGVWWHLFAYTWKEGDRSRVLVHLLSAPKNDKVNSNRSGVAGKVTNVSVRYDGPEAVTQAWELSPFIQDFCKPLAVQEKTVRPGDFHLWKIVVFELKGGGAR
jgi:hypothetical protein